MASEGPAFDLFGINRKNKAINTYGKARNNTTCTATNTTTSVAKRSKFGSLSDRLQLIDATPTGEDPYQLREADFSDLPPIPKLILRKANHGRMKVLNQPSRRIYDPASPEPKTTKRTSCCLSNNFATDLEKEAKTMIIQKSYLDLVKTEREIDWWIYLSKTIEGTQSMPVKYSVSDSCRNPASFISLDCNEFQELFTSDSALNLEELNVVTTLSSPAILPYEQPKKQVPSPKDMLAQFEAIINKL